MAGLCSPPRRTWGRPATTGRSLPQINLIPPAISDAQPPCCRTLPGNSSVCSRPSFCMAPNALISESCNAARYSVDLREVWLRGFIQAQMGRSLLELGLKNGATLVSVRCVPGVSPRGTAPHGRHTGVSPARHRSHAGALPEHWEWRTVRPEVVVLPKILIANLLRIGIRSDRAGWFQEAPCLTPWRPRTLRFARSSRIHEGYSTDQLAAIYSPSPRNDSQRHRNRKGLAPGRVLSPVGAHLPWSNCWWSSRWRP